MKATQEKNTIVGCSGATAFSRLGPAKNLNGSNMNSAHKQHKQATARRSGKLDLSAPPTGPAAGRRSALLAMLAMVVLLALPRAANAQYSQSDSWDFPLDTRGPDTGVAGVLQADSSDFALDTRGADTGPSGVLQADSADFTLDTTGPDTGAAGVLAADSLDIILDTRGPDTGGGVLLADSPDFELDTRDGFDIGLRVFDGIAVIKIAVEAPGAGGHMASTLRVNKGGTNYGILLIPTNWPDASRIRIQTSTGTKAWRKLP